MISENIYKHQFENNKYLKWYFSIISTALSQSRVKNNTIIYESHHILPKSIFPNHKNLKQNLVLLTPKEHFVCHRLLIKFTKGKDQHKMRKAITCFSMNNKHQGRYLTSKQYCTIREEYIKSSSGEFNPFYGKHHTPERKQQQSEKMTGRYSGEANPMFGRVGENHPMFGRVGEDHPMFGKTHSPDSKRKMSQYHSGKHGGVNNANFRGYWVTPYGTFDRSSSISDIISAQILRKWCKNNKTIITVDTYNSSKFLKKLYDPSVIGLSYKELGFDFIPI